MKRKAKVLAKKTKHYEPKLSLHPLEFDEAVSALLKVKPGKKSKNK